MDWSYTHDRMMSSLERLLHPKEYVHYYFCGLLLFKRRKRSSDTESTE